MVLRTFVNRNNTLIYNSTTNTGKNPITELYYGGKDAENSYTRFLFHFDESRLKELYTGGTYSDLSKLTHTLRLTNTAAFDKALLGGTTTCGGKNRASSFDLILFPINQQWDEGNGCDFGTCDVVAGTSTTSIYPSNWTEAQTNVSWSGGSGVYTGTTSGITSQHFEHGNENIEMDITDTVNAYLTGDTNYGLGLAFARSYEITETNSYQFTGFYTRHTETFYEPHVESIYSDKIMDDRAYFYLDKPNKLYLYSNLNGEPTNLDSSPSVIIKDNDDVVFSSITSSAVTQVTKGVYSVDITVPTTTAYTECLMFTDTWTGITIGGISRSDVELEFALTSSDDYYDIGSETSEPKKFMFNVSGIKRDERIYKGDIRRVTTTARIPYTSNQPSTVDGIKYRLYVKEGRAEYTVIEFQDVEQAFSSNYFLLDTQSLIPNIYYLDIQVSSNNEVTTYKDALKFEIVSQEELRNQVD